MLSRYTTPNPFLKRNGELVNPYINYQAMLDSDNINDLTKTFIEDATGLKRKVLISKNDEQANEERENVASSSSDETSKMDINVPKSVSDNTTVQTNGFVDKITDSSKGIDSNYDAMKFLENATGIKPVKTEVNMDKYIAEYTEKQKQEGNSVPEDVTKTTVSNATTMSKSSNTNGSESKPKINSSDDGGFGMPITTSAYRVSSWYGPRDTGIPGASKYHKAVDIACNGGEDVVSVKSGKVIYSGWVDGYGYTAEVDHGNGVVTKYHHMAEAPKVKVGDAVSKGQVVGKIGSTGISSGNHLDFQIFINGEAKDPALYLPLKRN